METKQGLTQAEEKIDRGMIMKGWIVANGTLRQLEANRIVAIAMIAQGVVEEVAPSINKKSKTVTKMTSGTSTRDPTTSKKKLLIEGSLLTELKEVVMVTERKIMTGIKEAGKIREEAVMIKGVAEVGVEATMIREVAGVDEVAMMTREGAVVGAEVMRNKSDLLPKIQAMLNMLTQETR